VVPMLAPSLELRRPHLITIRALAPARGLSGLMPLRSDPHLQLAAKAHLQWGLK
jgi:hypothetical protein